MTNVDSSGEGRFVDGQCTTTSEIPVGTILERDSSGYAIIPTTTPGYVWGVAATKIDSVTTAALVDITVQTTGVASVRVSADEGDYGEYIVAMGSGTTAGMGTSHSGDASTLNPQKIVGRVLTPPNSGETTAVVLMGQC